MTRDEVAYLMDSVAERVMAEFADDPHLDPAIASIARIKAVQDAQFAALTAAWNAAKERIEKKESI